MHCLYNKFVVELLLPLLCMRLSAQEDALGQVWSMWLQTRRNVLGFFWIKLKVLLVADTKIFQKQITPNKSV
jgi:hypothetical protein